MQLCCIPNFELTLKKATSTLKEMNVTHDPLSVHLSVLPHQKLNEVESNLLSYKGHVCLLGAGRKVIYEDYHLYDAYKALYPDLQIEKSAMSKFLVKYDRIESRG